MVPINRMHHVTTHASNKNSYPFISSNVFWHPTIVTVIDDNDRNKLRKYEILKYDTIIMNHC